MFQLAKRQFTEKLLEKHFGMTSSIPLSHLNCNALLSPSPIPSSDPSQTYIRGSRIDLVLRLAWKMLNLVLERLFIINYKNNLTKKKKEKETNPKPLQSFDSSAASKPFEAQVEKDISLKETT